MCGICGYITNKKLHDIEVIEKMLKALKHRGPDGAGTFKRDINQQSVLFGHTRLSIIDLDERANQPITFEHLTIVYNGEVYNFRDIKSELKTKGYTFFTSSDTEVVLKALHCWGLDACAKFNGMFALAIFDEIMKTVTLIRDRLGVKPLFYSINSDNLIFASEIKAIKAAQIKPLSINHHSMIEYFQYGFSRGTSTIYEGVFQLEPGTALVYNVEEKSTWHEKLWELEKVFKTPKITIPEPTMLEELNALLIDACRLRMISDVPVGVFLSGGYDSSLVAGILQQHTNTTINTFSIGFADKTFDEAVYAREISAYLGTNHSELYCSDEDAIRIVEGLADIWDEPFADTSAIPSALLSEFASSSVKVSLSADGGDEIFAGYKKYNQLLKKDRVYQKIQGIPSLVSLMQFASGLVTNVAGIDVHPTIKKFTRTIDEIGIEFPSIFEKNQHVFELKDLTHYFNFLNPGNEAIRPLETEGLSKLDQMLMWDLGGYLPDNVLRKVDRSTMAYSLEGREPLLDFRLIEFMSKIKTDAKFPNGELKYLLKKVCHNYIPKHLLDRPKKGFNAPILGWMRGCLKNMVVDILSEERIKASHIYNTEAVLSLRDDLLAGSNHEYRKLWSLFVFENWLQSNER